MPNIRIALLAATLIIAGCRLTKPPNTVLQPVIPATSDDTLLKSVGPWALTQSHQPHVYHSVSHTIVHELSDPAMRQKSIEVITTFTI